MEVFLELLLVDNKQLSFYILNFFGSLKSSFLQMGFERGKICNRRDLRNNNGCRTWPKHNRCKFFAQFSLPWINYTTLNVLLYYLWKSEPKREKEGKGMGRKCKETRKRWKREIKTFDTYAHTHIHIHTHVHTQKKTNQPNPNHSRISINA